MTIPPNFVPTQQAIETNTVSQFDQPMGEAALSAQESGSIGRLDPGMDVCDCDGNKLGSVSQVYRSEPAPAGAASNDSSHAPDIVEVKTGPLGLGKHLWIPLSAIADVTAGSVFINATKQQITEHGWETKPAQLA